MYYDVLRVEEVRSRGEKSRRGRVRRREKQEGCRKERGVGLKRWVEMGEERIEG